MIAFMLVTYTILLILLTKYGVLKPRPVPIACAIVFGVLLIGSVAVVWILCAPMSGKVVTTQFVVQIVPYVKGQVKRVHALPNVPIERGFLLFEINPDPYRFAVDQLAAQLQAAKDDEQQSDAGLQAAGANVQKSVAAVAEAQAGVALAKATLDSAQAVVVNAKAAADLAKSQLDIDLAVAKAATGAISKAKLVDAEQNLKEADASLKQAETGIPQAQAKIVQAEAAVKQSQFAQAQAEAAQRQAGFALQITRSNVVAAEAQLQDARFNLEQCQITAPSDGYVVDWQIRDGSMIVPMPMSPAGTFIDTTQTSVAAVFPQNYLMNVRAGDPVELVMDPYPGRLLQGEVENVIEATGEGQFAPGGKLPEASTIGSQGLLAVKIRLTGEDRAVKLPLGAGGAVAIYTSSGKPVHVISKVAIRMKKWLLYVIPS